MSIGEGDRPRADRSVSVVVPTFRRPEGIARVLRALASQVDPGVPWEVVVVDNDRPSATIQDVVASASGAIPVPVKLVNEPQSGSAFARNRGMDEATGSIVAFLDDDVEPGPTWLRELLVPILEGRSEATGGRVVLDPSVERPWWYREEFNSYLIDFELGDQEVEISPEGCVLTASAAFDLDLLQKVGGFDHALGPRGNVQLVNDDLSICRRFMATGARIRYAPASVVVHELPPKRLKIGYVIRRLYSQGRSDWLIDRDVLVNRSWIGPGGTMRQVVRILRDGPVQAERCKDRGPVELKRRPVWGITQIAWALGFIREAVHAKIFGRRS